MIVNYQEEGWQIISQRSHGLLAGQICFQWKAANRPERWVETIIATTEHDDVFNEFNNDKVLLNENGGPVNYAMRTFDLEKCNELLSLALSKSRYVALLTARHMRFLYENEESKEAVKYCRELEKLEEVWIKEAGFKNSDVTRAYEILEWCDALSLLICQQLIQPENRKIEISTGPDNRHYELWSTGENELSVSPWPFETDAFTIYYESKTLPQLKFKSVTEFRKHLETTVPQFHTYKIKKAV